MEKRVRIQHAAARSHKDPAQERFRASLRDYRVEKQTQMDDDGPPSSITHTRVEAE